MTEIFCIRNQQEASARQHPTLPQPVRRMEDIMHPLPPICQKPHSQRNKNRKGCTYCNTDPYTFQSYFMKNNSAWSNKVHMEQINFQTLFSAKPEELCPNPFLLVPIGCKHVPNQVAGCQCHDGFMKRIRPYIFPKVQMGCTVSRTNQGRKGKHPPPDLHARRFEMLHPQIASEDKIESAVEKWRKSTSHHTYIYHPLPRKYISAEKHSHQENPTGT